MDTDFFSALSYFHLILVMTCGIIFFGIARRYSIKDIHGEIHCQILIK
jgi:hypothetical protein